MNNRKYTSILWNKYSVKGYQIYQYIVFASLYPRLNTPSDLITLQYKVVNRNLSKSQPSLIDSRHQEISFPKYSHLILPNDNFEIIDDDDFDISQMYP